MLLALQGSLELQATLGQQVAQAILVLQVPLAQQVLQEGQGRLGLQDMVSLVLQAQLDILERLELQELQVVQGRLAIQERQAQQGTQVQQDILVALVAQALLE